jgi:hypothetical protein
MLAIPNEFHLMDPIRAGRRARKAERTAFSP